MKNTLQFASLVLVGAMALVACGDDGTGGSGGTGGTGGNPSTGGSPSTGGGGNPSTGGGGDGGGGGIPAPPEPGAQIDRMGRPAINTALVGTFVLEEAAPNMVVPSDNTSRGMLQDAYNADGMENGWAANTPMFAANLAILDALDSGAGPGTGCGNQPGVPKDCDGALECYGTVAGVLANDRIFVNTAGTGCSAAASASDSYLAVEFFTLGNEAFENACGGRRPIDDVIAVTYSTVAGIPFDDMITAPAATHPETFPYLANPQ
jgi:hypothetical protein